MTITIGTVSLPSRFILVGTMSHCSLPRYALAAARDRSKDDRLRAQEMSGSINGNATEQACTFTRGINLGHTKS